MGPVTRSPGLSSWRRANAMPLCGRASALHLGLRARRRGVCGNCGVFALGGPPKPPSARVRGDRSTPACTRQSIQMSPAVFALGAEALRFRAVVVHLPGPWRRSAPCPRLRPLPLSRCRSRLRYSSSDCVGLAACSARRLTSAALPCHARTNPVWGGRAPLPGSLREGNGTGPCLPHPRCHRRHRPDEPAEAIPAA